LKEYGICIQPLILSCAATLLLSVPGVAGPTKRQPATNDAVLIPILAAERDGERSRLRFHNTRIAEVFRYAVKKSPAFEDLVAALEQQDRVVYVDEGRCRQPEVSSCLQLLGTSGAKYIQIRIAPREPLKLVVARLAHELYHASEIGRDPSVVDAASLQALYERIGYRNKTCPDKDCWETRAAVAFEALVTRELNGT
jgi:hypothetical protein